MDPALLVGCASIVGTLVLGFLTIRGDKQSTDSSTRSSDTDAAIDSLRAAFLTQQGLTHDCQQQCKELADELEAAKVRIAELEKMKP